MIRGGYIYLATVYSKYHEGLEAAHHIAARRLADLIRAGVPAFSPIVHCHSAARHGEIDPLDHDIWIPADAPFVRNASGLLVHQMHGWRESKGIQIEIDEFQRVGKPDWYWPVGEKLWPALVAMMKRVCIDDANQN